MNINEKVTKAVEEKHNPEYGVPEQEKYPLYDKHHVESAIKLFGHVEPKYEAHLAHAIISRMKKYGIPFDAVGKDNKLYDYLPNKKLDEDIQSYKTEKRINVIKESMMKSFTKVIEESKGNVSAARLNIKYLPLSEFISNFDYESSLLEMTNSIKNAVFNFDDRTISSLLESSFLSDSKVAAFESVSSLRDFIAKSKVMIESSDISTFEKGYTNLLKVITITEAGKEFMAAYEKGGKDLDNYLSKRSAKHQAKGMSKTDADSKAEKDYETRAHNIYAHTDREPKPATGERKFPAQVKKY